MTVAETTPLDTATAEAAAATLDRRRWFALAVLCAGMLMIILDETVVNVALDSIQRDLGFSPSGLAWVVNAYLIAFGGLLLLAGRIGDLLGRRSLFIAGLVVFTAASAAAGLSTSPAMLVAARFVQGAGGALTSSVVLGMIVTTFTDPRERAKAIGAFSFAAAAGASIGLVLGGAIAEALSWHWVFFVNIPVGVAAIILTRRVLPPTAGIGVQQGADVTGAILVTGAVMVGVAAIVGTEDHGWATARTLGLLSLAAVLLGGFVVRQASAHTPLVPLRLFRSRAISGANAIYALVVGGLFGFQFMAALYLQRVLGYSPGQVGLAIAPVAVAIGTTSLLVAPRLSARFGPTRLLVPGLVVLAGGVALLTRLPTDGRYLTDLLPAFVVMGIGFGIAQPALTTLAMSEATERDSGLASGLFNTTQQVSGALGLAIATSVSTARADRALDHGAAAASALTDGYAAAFTVSTALVVAAAVLAILVVRRRDIDKSI